MTTEQEPIKRQVGKVFKLVIQDWDDDWKKFDEENWLNSKAVSKILLIILKRLEENEQSS